MHGYMEVNIKKESCCKCYTPVIINITVFAEWQVVIIHAMNAYSGSGVIAPLNNNLSIRRS